MAPTSHLELFRIKRWNFELKKGSTTLYRLMDLELFRIKLQFIIVKLDNVVVDFGLTEQHIYNLGHVLDLLSNSRATLGRTMRRFSLDINAYFDRVTCSRQLSLTHNKNYPCL